MVETPVFLDANVFIYFRIDKGVLRERAKARLDSLVDGQLKATVSPLVLDEVLWIVWKHKGRETAIDFIEGLIFSFPIKYLDIPGNLMEIALPFISNYNLKPRDALHAATMQHHGLTHIISNDSDFDRVPWMTREEI